MSLDSYVSTLSPEAQQYAEENLRETAAVREAAVKEIRAWLVTNKELKARLSYSYILPFLRACKYNLENTKAKITNYYLLRKKCPQWFTNRNPNLPQLQDLLKMGVFNVLRNTNSKKMVVVAKTCIQNPSIYSLDDVVKLGCMILDVAAKGNEEVQVYGVTAIFDMQGLNWRIVKQLTPHFIKNVVNSWQNYHIRVKNLEFINAPYFINVILNIFIKFMSEKLRKRLYVHQDGLGTLHERVDLRILPPEYGGSGETIQELAEYWKIQLANNIDFLQDDEQYKAL